MIDSTSKSFFFAHGKQPSWLGWKCGKKFIDIIEMSQGWRDGNHFLKVWSEREVFAMNNFPMKMKSNWDKPILISIHEASIARQLAP